MRRPSRSLAGAQKDIHGGFVLHPFIRAENDRRMRACGRKIPSVYFPRLHLFLELGNGLAPRSGSFDISPALPRRFPISGFERSSGPWFNVCNPLAATIVCFLFNDREKMPPQCQANELLLFVRSSASALFQKVEQTLLHSNWHGCSWHGPNVAQRYTLATVVLIVICLACHLPQTA